MEAFWEFQGKYVGDTTNKNETFADCCKNISQQLNPVLELFKNEKIATEEWAIIEGMLQVDPAKRLTGVQVMEALARQEKISDTSPQTSNHCQ
jgi:hypothetical protein